MSILGVIFRAKVSYYDIVLSDTFPIQAQISWQSAPIHAPFHVTDRLLQVIYRDYCDELPPEITPLNRG
jgi:hypothetical protein